VCRNLDKALAGELFGSAPRKPRDVRMHIKLLRHKPKFAGAEEYRIAEAIVVLAKLGKLADKRDIKLSHLDYRRLELEVDETGTASQQWITLSCRRQMFVDRPLR
jgi:hypothetical protein